MNPELRNKPTVADGIVYHKSNHGEPGPHSELVEYQPGNGTRYLLLITSVRTIEGAEAKLGLQYNSVIVTDMLHSRTMVLAPEGFLHWQYVKEKMELRSIPDAVVLAELLGHITGREAISSEEASRELQSA